MIGGQESELGAGKVRKAVLESRQERRGDEDEGTESGNSAAVGQMRLGEQRNMTERNSSQHWGNFVAILCTEAGVTCVPVLLMLLVSSACTVAHRSKGEKAFLSISFFYLFLLACLSSSLCMLDTKLLIVKNLSFIFLILPQITEFQGVYLIAFS